MTDYPLIVVAVVFALVLFRAFYQYFSTSQFYLLEYQTTNRDGTQCKQIIVMARSIKVARQQADLHAGGTWKMMKLTKISERDMRDGMEFKM